MPVPTLDVIIQIMHPQTEITFNAWCKSGLWFSLLYFSTGDEMIFLTTMYNCILSAMSRKQQQYLNICFTLLFHIRLNLSLHMALGCSGDVDSSNLCFPVTTVKSLHLQMHGKL